LRHYWLGIENLIFGFNHEETTRYDLRFGFTNGPKSIEQYLDTQENKVSKHEDLIANFNLFEED
jgi:hypothetical protein